MEETILTSGGETELSWQLKAQDLESQLLDLKVKYDELARDNAQLKRENNQLKMMPLIVAEVIDLLGKREENLRQQGK
ncbi:MAG: peptidase, partial [Methanoregulaceae archaeon]|nr:peptidase [Methanoregulaceae archaeon]